MPSRNAGQIQFSNGVDMTPNSPDGHLVTFGGLLDDSGDYQEIADGPHGRIAGPGHDAESRTGR
jgi:hypothetical protein